MKIELVKQDWKSLLQSVEDDSADLIILDPYYNHWKEFIKEGIITEALRCLKPEGNLLCFTQQPFDLELRLASPDNFRRELIWRFPKRPKWVSKKLPLVYHQKIMWFVKSKNNHFFNCRSGMDYSDKTCFGDKGYMVFEGYKEKLKKYEKHPEGIWIPDLLSFDKPFKTEHQGQKPQGLIDVLVRCFSPNDGFVIDPFIGFGTTAYATIGSERKLKGGDINDKWFPKILNKN